MEDYIQILFILGAALVAFFQSSKKKAAKEEKRADGIPAPCAEEDSPESTWMPAPADSSDSLPGSRPVFMPAFEPQPAPKAKPIPKERPAPKARPKASAYRPIEIKPAEQHPDTAAPPAADDFSIRSAEEARKAIIWGEILQRKY